MHLKDLMGSFVRVGYRIPVQDFYLVPHGLRCRKSTIMDQSINQSPSAVYSSMSRITEADPLSAGLMIMFVSV